MNRPLAPYAVSDAASRGRQHPEPARDDESPFEDDRHRVLNCMAFRRLMHKTQVFLTDCGDHFRTRLTHTLEVVAQAQHLAARLSVNDRLAGAIALAHDLGHAPFGHAGEAALGEHMAAHGGFEHNLQSLRVVDYLEHPCPDFRGLNLSFELRESLIKHHTRFDHPPVSVIGGSGQALLETGPQAPLEGQVVNLADVIAYTLHDIEDGLVEGALGEGALGEIRLWREASQEIRQRHPSAPLAAIRRPVLDALARRLQDDAVGETRQRILDSGIRGLDDVRRSPNELVGFSGEMQAGIEELQGLLLQAVYRNHRVVRMDSKARRIIRDLFDAYLSEPRLMPDRFTARVSEQGLHRVICDYIAGMTDRYCQEEHRRLYAPFHFG
jgi:dGTPase